MRAIRLVFNRVGMLPEASSQRLRRGILEHLVRDAGYVKVSKPLAHAFGLRRKAFRREIDRMIADGAALRWSGRSNLLLKHKHHMLTLSLSDDELATLVFSLRATSYRGSTNSDMRDATLILADVLRQASPMTRGYAISLDQGRAGPARPPRDLPGDLDPLARNKAAITQAMTGWTKLVIHYTDASEARTVRTVWPFATTYHGSTLAAWCELRDGFRHFRIDQIAMPVVTEIPIPRLVEDLMHDWRAETGSTPDTEVEDD